jgi:hypothetical protein
MPAGNLVISNVPGPRKPLYAAGARLEHYFPVSVITEGLGLNITVHSYLDHLDFGLVCCPELMPDVDVLLDAILAEIDALGALAAAAGGGEKPAAKRRGRARKPAAAAGRSS